ncbi:hypothetical protein ACFXPZ_02330 [Streptomyces sp. NPDC059101]|uniref:hypothetical protein n=1 Tax=Streptomyces sp. NPDC059101 TaxID=3346728 RepID=UPI0036B60580
MLIFPREGSTGLLTVEGSTYPDYLSVSTSYNTEVGAVTLYIGPPAGGSQSIFCRKIVVRVPTGPGADALTTNAHAPAIAISVPEPGNQLPGRRWTVKLDTSSDSYAEVTCTPEGFGNSGFAEFKTGSRKVGFTLSQIAIHPIPGDVEITVFEDSSYQPETGYTTRRSFYDVRKYQGILYFHSLRAEPSFIERGQSATLLWDGSPEADYTMFANGRPHLEHNPPSGGTWTSEPLDDDTEFTLEAKTMGPGDTPIYRQLTTSVKVDNANKRLNSIKVGTINAPTAGGRVRVADDLTLGQGKTLDADHINASAAGAITVDTHLALATGKTLSVDKVNPSTTNRAITVDTDLTLAANKTLSVDKVNPSTTNRAITIDTDLTLAANKTLKVDKVDATGGSGTLTIGSSRIFTEGDLTLGPGKTLDADHINASAAGTITVDTHLTVEGLFTANGPTDMVQSFKATELGLGQRSSFTAETSGILVVLCRAENSGSTVRATVKIDSRGYLPASHADHSNGNWGEHCFAIAVRKGARCEILVEKKRGNPQYQVGWYLWCPLGKGATMAEIEE